MACDLIIYYSSLARTGIMSQTTKISHLYVLDLVRLPLPRVIHCWRKEVSEPKAEYEILRTPDSLAVLIFLANMMSVIISALCHKRMFYKYCMKKNSLLHIHMRERERERLG